MTTDDIVRRFTDIMLPPPPRVYVDYEFIAIRVQLIALGQWHDNCDIWVDAYTAAAQRSSPNTPPEVVRAQVIEVANGQ
jgi:hypothetical protein